MYVLFPPSLGIARSVSDHPEGTVSHSCCWIHGYCKAEMVVSHNTDPNQNVLVSCWPNCLILVQPLFFQRDWSAAREAPLPLCVISIFPFHTQHMQNNRQPQAHRHKTGSLIQKWTKMGSLKHDKKQLNNQVPKHFGNEGWNEWFKGERLQHKDQESHPRWH